MAISSATITSITTDSGSSGSDYITNDTSVSVSGTYTSSNGASGNTFGVWAVSGSNWYFLGQVVGAKSSTNVAWSFTNTTHFLAEGSYTLEIVQSTNQTDANPGGTVITTHALTVDTTGPSLTGLPGSVQDSWTTANPNGAGNVALSGITVASDTVSLAIDVGAGNTFTENAGSGATVTLVGSVYTITGSAAQISAALNGGVIHTDLTDVTTGNTDFSVSLVTTDTAGNTATSSLAVDVICFMPGTLIATPTGAVAVETLQHGDLVLTHDGLVKPVAWLGRQTVSTIFADKTRVLPIRVKAGALADAVPARDLLVSPDHALLVDGVLIHAGALVNGSSIVRETAVPTVFTYYHVELDDHSLVLAENTPAETFVDSIDRLGFDNWAEHEALYPEGKPIVEMPYPRAKALRQVPIDVRVRLADRAESLGFAAAAVA